MAIVEVVKYNGKPTDMTWKYPNEELGTWTQVVVNETQEVVFVKNGKILDILGPGKHTLSTENIPILSKLINLPFGGKSPFKAELWYINKACNLDVKWGTAPAIQIEDPKYHVFIPVTAHGQFGVQVGDSRTFITRLVGTLTSFNNDDMVKYFRGLLVSTVKDLISEYFVSKKISILEVNAYISDISEELETKLKPKVEEFGINLVNFYVSAIEAPEDDPAVKKLKDALAKKAEMDIIGYDYTTQRSFDTLESAAKNEGSGANLMNAGIGLGMGFGVGGKIGNEMGEISSKMNTNSNKKEKHTVKCKKCGSEVDANLKFCPECGASQVNVCPKCNHEVPEGTKFCPECGEKL